MYPNYPNLYGLPNAISSDAKCYDVRNMSIFLDTIASSHNKLHTTVTSQAMSRLAQSASVIQGQMAASQIPLCIVQDQSGQLHQLVYMVPEHLYQSYIAAAARGMKVNLPPKLDRFNAFLNGGATSSTGESSVKATGTTTPSKLISNIATEKMVKNPSTTSEKTDNNDAKDKKAKANNNSKDIIDLKTDLISKGSISVPKTVKQTTEEPTKKSVVSTTKPSVSKSNTRPPTPHKSPNTHVQVTVCSQQNPKNDLVSKRIYTVTPNIHGLREAHFLTNELFPLIKTSKNDIFIKNCKQFDNNSKLQTNNSGSVTKEQTVKKTSNGNKDTSKSSNETHIDLTIKPGTINDAKAVTTSTVDKCNKNDKKNDSVTPKESKSTKPTSSNNTNTPVSNKNINNERNSSNPEKDKLKKTSTNKSKTIVYPETFDSSTSIDDILSQNNSDLIPKSDVESLLKCLKRKLEEKEDAERAVKRANHTVSECDRNAANRGLFDEPGDLFSSFDGSPESEEAPSPNFFFQSRDMGSVSSVDSALSYNQQSSVSSENSDSNANTFNFLEEILAEDKHASYIDREAVQNEIFEITSQENSNQFSTDIGLVDALHNHTQDNIDFSFLENLKGNYLDCDNIFDTVENKNEGSVETNDDVLGKDESPKSSTSPYTDQVSFPTEPAEDGDLFDHLWNELDNL